MMSKKIEELSFKDILNKFGMPVGIEDIRAAYKYNAKSSKVKEFEQKLGALSPSAIKGQVELLSEYEDIFDKEIYIFHIAKLIELDTNQEERSSFLGVGHKTLIKFVGERKNKNNKAALITNAKELLESSDVADLTIDKKTRKIIVDLSQDFIGKTGVLTRRKNRSEKKLAQIEARIKLTELLSVLYPSDIVDISRYPNFGNVLSIDIYKCAQADKNEEKVEDIYKSKKLFYRSDFEKIIRENIHFIDIDKLLLLYLRVNFENVNNEVFLKKDAEELQKKAEKIYGYLDDSYISMYVSRYKEETHFDELQKRIEDVNTRFDGDKYYTDSMLNEARDKLLCKSKKLYDYSPEIIKKIIDINPDILEKFSKLGLKNLEFLCKNNFITIKNVKEINIGDLPVEEVYYLYSSKKIDIDIISDEYFSKKLPEDTLYELKDILSKEDIDTIANEKKLVDLYLKNPESNEYNEYKKCFYKLRIENKSLEDRIAIGTSIVNQSKKMLEFNKLLDLLYQDLIPIEVIAKVCNESIFAVIATVRIRPAEIRKRYENDSLTYDMICELLCNKKINNLNKLVLICSTFSSFSDEKLRTKFLNYYISSNIMDKDLKKKTKEEFEDNRLYSIWNNIYELDNDYDQEIISSGAITFRLPNLKKYVVRKVFNSNYGFVYGSAIYVFDKEVFEKNKDKIVQKNELNISTIEKFVNSEEAVKIIDTGWDDSLKMHLIGKKEKKYTKDQLSKIDDLLKKVKK